MKISVFSFERLTQFSMGSAKAIYEQLFQKISENLKKKVTHKQTMMRLFRFFTFYYSFLLLTVFFLKEAVHQRAFCSYIVIFTEENTVQPFFFLLKTISEGISSTHIIIPYIMIIYFQCQAQEITHDQCVNLSVVHIRSI